MLRCRLIQIFASVCLLMVLLADMPSANAQLFRRLRQQAQQYRAPTTRQAQPSRQVVQPNRQVVQPNQQAIRPNVQQNPGAQVAQPTQRITIDPRTGRQVVVQVQPQQTAPVAQTAPVVQPVRLPIFRDARTGRIVAIDPRTGQVVPNVATNQVFVDQQTGKPYVLGNSLATSPTGAQGQSPATIAGGPITVSPTVSAARPVTSPSPTPAAPLASADAAESDGADDDKMTAGNSILAGPINAPRIRPTLGIQVSENSEGIPGIIVDNFKPHSLADEAGLRVGDRVYSINGIPTRTVSSLAGELENFKAGERVVLRIGRGNRISDIAIPLVEHPGVAAATDNSSVSLGNPAVPVQRSQSTNPTIPPNTTARAASSRVEMSNALTPADRIALGVDVVDVRGGRGVVVKQVEAKSPAENAGLAVGDRIVSVDGRMVSNAASLDREVNGRASRNQLSLKLVRNNQLLTSYVRFNSPKTAALKPADDSASEPKVTEKKSSTFGAMLGGLFGSNSASETDSEPAKDEPAKNESGKSILQAPIAITPPAVEQSGFARDEMAFGDEEPIQAAIFNSEPIAAAVPEPKLEEPTRSSSADRKSAEVIKLQSEIDRLKAQLEKAKSK